MIDFKVAIDMKKTKVLLIISCIILLIVTMLTGCSVDKEFTYSSNPTFDVMYSEDTNTSEVSVRVYIDNFYSDAAINSITFRCYFLDENNNLLDTQEKTFNVNIQKESSGNYIFVFDDVTGRPQNIRLINTSSSFDQTMQEKVGEWFSAYWWIILIIVAYIAIGIGIGCACGSYVVADFDLTESEFWISLACGLFWPIGGIVLLVIYLKDEVFIGAGDYEEQGDFDGWTVEELKDYCRENGISGYSKLTKSELISLIESNDLTDEEDNLDTKPYNKSKKSESATKNSIIPKIKFSDIAGLDEAKQTIYERVVLPLKHKDIYKKYGKKVGGGVLLYGLPGTGKTMFAQAVATELNAKFFNIKCSDIMSKWYGESEQRIKKLFADARKNEVSVVFFDEFDAIGKSRTENDNNDITTVQEILAQMQGVEQNKNIMLVLAATNCPWNLDSALLRPGRFHEKIYIPLPDLSARTYMLNKNLGDLKKDANVSFEEVAKKLEGFNGADVAEFCEQIKMCLINKELSGNSNVLIQQCDIDKTLQKVHSSVSEIDIETMENYRMAYEH